MNTKDIIKKYDDISDFFRNATSEDREAVMLDIAKKAIQDQRDLMKKA